MNIDIRTIPHHAQRYETVGDWFFDEEGLHIRVSKMSDQRYEWLVGIHELVEVLLCKAAGITQEEVDAFDMAYEKKRPEGDDSEPGDDLQAPYALQHSIATGVERVVAAFLGVSWSLYDADIQSL